MSAVIRKYPMPVQDRTTVVLPRNADILHIGAQGLELFVWALVDPLAALTVEHEYLIFGTGNEVPNGGEGLGHLATILVANGLVWHVFQEETF